jgi:hypothetical protein
MDMDTQECTTPPPNWRIFEQIVSKIGIGIGIGIENDLEIWIEIVLGIWIESDLGIGI